jgi:hypothetical protein
MSISGQSTTAGNSTNDGRKKYSRKKGKNKSPGTELEIKDYNSKLLSSKAMISPAHTPPI